MIHHYVNVVVLTCSQGWTWRTVHKKCVALQEHKEQHSLDVRAWEQRGRHGNKPRLEPLPYLPFVLPPDNEKKIRMDASHIITTTEFGRRYKCIVTYW